MPDLTKVHAAAENLYGLLHDLCPSLITIRTEGGLEGALLAQALNEMRDALGYPKPKVLEPA